MDFSDPQMCQFLPAWAFAHVDPSAYNVHTRITAFHFSDQSPSRLQEAFFAHLWPQLYTPTEVFAINGAITIFLIIDVCVPHEAVRLAEMVSVIHQTFPSTVPGTLCILHRYFNGRRVLGALSLGRKSDLCHHEACDSGNELNEL